MYDDVGVRDFDEWSSVVKCCVGDLIKPTLMFYQKVHSQVRKSDALTITGYDLNFIERSARI